MPLIQGLDLGGGPCPDEPPSSCPGRPPRVAYVVAGDARGFLQPRIYSAYAQHVLRSFGGSPESQLFLFLKNIDESELASAARVLRPAAVHVERRASSPQMPAAGACLPRWTAWSQDFYQLRALRWWGAMNGSLAMVRKWESARRVVFHTLFFSRPDVFFVRGFGPWCRYQPSTWYTGGLGSPDSLWILPRKLARVLRSADEFMRCADHTHATCCAAQRKVDVSDPRHDDDVRRSQPTHGPRRRAMPDGRSRRAAVGLLVLADQVLDDHPPLQHLHGASWAGVRAAQGSRRARGPAGLKCRLPCLRTPPHLPPSGTV